MNQASSQIQNIACRFHGLMGPRGYMFMSHGDASRFKTAVLRHVSSVLDIKITGSHGAVNVTVEQ